MSAHRLKRKLGELGVDVTSRKANESFCLIGTPLPPLEKSKDTGEFVPLWKQEVRDEKGRRRLHGAFTGGFSAGYFNTVGSKEGWAPSTFVSSRGDRVKQKTARPEDFMDEEDLQDLKDSRTLVDTTDEMDLTAGTKSSVEETDSVAAALEASILPPANDSAGARILKKMGWKVGQGIGPRLTLRQKRLQDIDLSSGATSDLNIPEDDEEAAKHTYARRDVKVLLIDRKDNSHGLGYTPGMGLHESLGVKEDAGSSKGPRISAGFGLGALNDADDDDVDVYDGGLSTNRGRVAYDHLQDDDNNGIGSRVEKRGKQPIRSATVTEFFRDGQPVLKAFVLSNKPVTEDRWFPLPEIPNGWQPDPWQVWDKDQNKENAQEAHPALKGWDKKISADERGSMLGETPLPSAPRSVFDFMSKKDRERLQNIAVGLPHQPASATSAPLEIRMPFTEAHVAQAALRGFQPFALDPVKQDRYNTYLQSQLGTDAAGPPLAPSSKQRIDEFNKEVEDYAKAALLFKPISGAMAGRFTSAAVVEQGPKIHEGLHTPSAEELEAKEEEKQREEEAKISPKAHAAKMGMYGPLTREVKPWQPARLLCKRFGVKDPNPVVETPVDEGASASQPSWQAEEAAGADPNAGAEAGGSTSNRNGPKDLNNVGLGEDDDQGRDTLTYERPTMDVFKAIFASDEEDSDEEADGKDEDAEVVVPAAEPAEQGPPGVPAQNKVTFAEPEVVDLNTFKPTFIPREGKVKKDKVKDKDKDKDKDKEDKGKKDKKKNKRGVLSFEMDEDGGDELSLKPPKDRPKKRRKQKREDDDDAMWVEKPTPDLVKDLVVPLPPPTKPAEPPGNGVVEFEPVRVRKRAVDFL